MLSLAIFAGGKSQCMGQDKANIHFQGEALVCRTLDRLAGLAAEVIVSAPESQEFHSLGIRNVPDLLHGCGLLGGLYTALIAASHLAVGIPLEHDIDRLYSWRALQGLHTPGANRDALKEAVI